MTEKLERRIQAVELRIAKMGAELCELSGELFQIREENKFKASPPSMPDLAVLDEVVLPEEE